MRLWTLHENLHTWNLKPVTSWLTERNCVCFIESLRFVKDTYLDPEIRLSHNCIAFDVSKIIVTFCCFSGIVIYTRIHVGFEEVTSTRTRTVSWLWRIFYSAVYILRETCVAIIFNFVKYLKLKHRTYVRLDIHICSLRHTSITIRSNNQVSIVFFFSHSEQGSCWLLERCWKFKSWGRTERSTVTGYKRDYNWLRRKA